MAYQIHEFFPVCKLVTHPTTRQLVSGGFTNEIRKSSEIPDDVMNAVFESDEFGRYVISKNFNIPDTSPPKDDQVALIARDIGNYCILAVANAQKDDGNRQFVGYRFFWLSKLNLIQELPSDIPQFVDGVGTLLLFWQENQKLSFNISLISQNQRLSSYPLNKPYITKYFYDHYLQTLKDFSSKLTTIPSIFELNQDGRELTPEELHYLAIEARRMHQCPIAWAWNVRNLSEPQDFSVIYCADKNALQKLSQPKLPPTPPHIILTGRHPVSPSSQNENTLQRDNQLVISRENSESENSNQLAKNEGNNSKNSRKLDHRFVVVIWLFGAGLGVLSDRIFFSSTSIIITPSPSSVSLVKTFKDEITQLNNFVPKLTNQSAVKEPGKFAQQETYAFIRQLFVPELQTSININKTEDLEILQSALQATDFYQKNNYKPGKFTQVDAKAVKKFQKKYDSKYQTEVDGQVGPKTWSVLSKLFVDKQVEIAAHYLQKSFTIHNKDSDIEQDFKDIQSCKKEGSKNFINCVNKKIDQKHFNRLPKQ